MAPSVTSSNLVPAPVIKKERLLRNKSASREATPVSNISSTDPNMAKGGSSDVSLLPDYMWNNTDCE